MGQTEEAVVAYRSALRLDPKDAEAHNNLGLLLEKQHLRADAARHFNEALRIRPKFEEARKNFQRLLGRLGE